jgi:hypothetical protein
MLSFMQKKIEYCCFLQEAHHFEVFLLFSKSMHLSNGSGFGSVSCYFLHRPSKRQQKKNLCFSFSPYYFLKVYLHHFNRSHIAVEI